MELLNQRNANDYYANHCRWTHRPYASWQNNVSDNEVAAIDSSGRPMDPFRNHMKVIVRDVVRLVRERYLMARGQLRNPNWP